MGADRKPVDPKRKRQAFSSLFFLLLIYFVIQQEKKREEVCLLTRFRSALVNTLDQSRVSQNARLLLLLWDEMRYKFVIYVVPISIIEAQSNHKLAFLATSIMIIGTKNPQLLCKIHSYTHDLGSGYMKRILQEIFCKKNSFETRQRHLQRALSNKVGCVIVRRIFESSCKLLFL